MRKIIGACAIALTFSSGLSAQTVDLRSGTSWAPSSPMIANGGVGVKIKGVVENATVGPASIDTGMVWNGPLRWSGTAAAWAGDQREEKKELKSPVHQGFESSTL